MTQTAVDLLCEARRVAAEGRPMPLHERGGSDVISQARTFRTLLQRRERDATRQILDAWIGVRRRLVADIDQLTKAIGDIEAPTSGQILRLSQLQRLLDDVDTEVVRFGRQADRIIYDARRDVIQAAQADTATLIRRQLDAGIARTGITFRTVDPAAVESIVGTLGRGPVHDLLITLSLGQTDRLTAALIDGVARGLNPREIARELRRITGIPARRAETIARTEILRAYRQSAAATNRAHADLLTGHVWLARLDTATCAICIAMHGTVLPTSEVQGSHPRCRCTTVPQTKTWAELGFPDIPDTTTPVTSGSDWFDQLAPGRQRSILGPSRHDAYLAGTPLADMVVSRVDPRWGPVRQLRPVGP